MIKSFRHRGLRKLYEDGETRCLQADEVGKIRRILSYLEAAEIPQALHLPGYRFQQLKSEYRGFYSVTVTGNNSMIFRFVDGHAVDVDDADDHEGEYNMMHDPSHPGEVIKHDCIEASHLTVTDAADGLGVSRKALSELINCTSGVSPDMAIRLEKAGWGTAETWLRMQMQFDLWQARKKAGKLKVKRFEEAVHA